MENSENGSRIALIGVIVEQRESSEAINAILHENAKYVVGRMGIPYPKQNVSIISVVLDAPDNVISSISGKLGMIPGVSAKTVCSKIQWKDK